LGEKEVGEPRRPAVDCAPHNCSDGDAVAKRPRSSPRIAVASELELGGTLDVNVRQGSAFFEDDVGDVRLAV
jgi:hypothetical protein